MTQGCRPNSVTIQPSSIARKESGPASTTPRKSKRFSGTTRLRVENALQGSELHRLRACEETSIGIPADDLQRNNDGSHCHCQHESFAMVAIALAAQYGSSIDSGDAKTGRHVACQDHMCRLVGGTGVKDGLEGIDARYLPMHNL